MSFKRIRLDCEPRECKIGSLVLIHSGREWSELVHVVYRDGDMMIVTWTVDIDGPHPYDLYARMATNVLFQSVEIMRAPDQIPRELIEARVRQDSSVRGLRQALCAA